MRQNAKTVSPMSNEGRNQYVVEHITEAVLELMKNQNINEISISQICEEAGVGRASFYRNFESKEDVIRKYLAKLLKEWGTEFEDRGDPSYFSESLLKHYYKYRDVYLMIYQQRLSELIYETIRWATKIEEAQSNVERYVKSMTAGMIFGWVDEWLRQGMPETPEEIILLFEQNKSHGR